MTTSRHLLILGGTGEAVALARAVSDLFGPRIDVTSSLAGRTADPAPITGKVRIGGFGGAEGLRRYLRESNTAMVIDATHPFATQISRNAAAVAAGLSLPLLRLERPEWRRAPEDRWIEVADTREAVAALRPLARRIWLTIGTAALAPFAELADAWFLVRMITRPAAAPPLRHYQLRLDRGPFSVEAERELIAAHRVEALVTKASGGDITAAKLQAAREARIPVVMIRRPQPAPAEGVTSIPAALDWIRRHLDAG